MAATETAATYKKMCLTMVDRSVFAVNAHACCLGSLVIVLVPVHFTQQIKGTK